MGPRAGEHEGCMGPRAGEHKGRTGPIGCGFEHSHVPASKGSLFVPTGPRAGGVAALCCSVRGQSTHQPWTCGGQSTRGGGAEGRVDGCGGGGRGGRRRALHTEKRSAPRRRCIGGALQVRGRVAGGHSLATTDGAEGRLIRRLISASQREQRLLRRRAGHPHRAHLLLHGHSFHRRGGAYSAQRLTEARRGARARSARARSPAPVEHRVFKDSRLRDDRRDESRAVGERKWLCGLTVRE